MYRPPFYRSPEGAGEDSSKIPKEAYSVATRIAVALGLEGNDRKILNKADIQTKGTQKEIDLGNKVLNMLNSVKIPAVEIDVLSDEIRKSGLNPAYKTLFDMSLEYCYSKAVQPVEKDSEKKEEWLSEGLSEEEAVDPRYLRGNSGSHE